MVDDVELVVSQVDAVWEEEEVLWVVDDLEFLDFKLLRCNASDCVETTGTYGLKWHFLLEEFM